MIPHWVVVEGTLGQLSPVLFDSVLGMVLLLLGLGMVGTGRRWFAHPRRYDSTTIDLVRADRRHRARNLSKLAAICVLFGLLLILFGFGYVLAAAGGLA
jgi:hypothetical protein